MWLRLLPPQPADSCTLAQPGKPGRFKVYVRDSGTPPSHRLIGHSKA